MFVGQGLGAAQGALHGAVAHIGLIECAQNGLRLAADFAEHIAKLAEFGFDCAQNLPDFAAALLQRQGAKAHLQGVEHD